MDAAAAEAGQHTLQTIQRRAASAWKHAVAWIGQKAELKILAPAIGLAGVLYLIELLRQRDLSARRAREIHGKRILSRNLRHKAQWSSQG